MKNTKGGFSLVEVLLVSGFTVVVIAGLIQLFVYCNKLAAAAGNMSFAMAEAQSKMEEMRNTNFASVLTDYSPSGTPGNTFSLTNLTGKGVIYIDSSSSDIYTVQITVCWREYDGRIVGEDGDLDGALGVSEDTDGNGKISSPVTLLSMIARK